jgi:magnesium chelatase family protein
LALTGEIRPVLGVLLGARLPRRRAHPAGPTENGPEASLIQDAEVRTAHQLLAVTAWLAGQYELPLPEPQTTETLPDVPDLQDVIGQSQAKRALEIAAAGSHNLLFIGPPAPARACWPAVARHSAAAERTGGAADRRHPLHRRPHPTRRSLASQALSHAPSQRLGGGAGGRWQPPRPGEISLAHNGVLFLDELPEFERKVLDSLREPLETGHITISRAARQVDFPARFQLVGAMNPSPCGHYGDGQTRSSPDQILRYLGKLSGPFLDRFDLTVEVPLLPKGSLTGKAERGESSQQIRERVLAAREQMLSRNGKLNNLLDSREIEEICRLSPQDAEFLENAIQKLGLSIRAWHRILRVSRTIADLAGRQAIEKEHLIEALGYRAMDRLSSRLRSG